jgi:hypothetical protein
MTKKVNQAEWILSFLVLSDLQKYPDLMFRYLNFNLFVLYSCFLKIESGIKIPVPITSDFVPIVKT